MDKTFEQQAISEFVDRFNNYRPEPNKPKVPNEVVDNIVSGMYVSKEIREFESGSRRDANDHKPRIADLKAYTRKRFGYHMLKGSKNYGIGNFEKGQPDESSLESIHRHLVDYEMGDRSECHLSSILFGIQLIILNEQKDGVPADFYYQKYLDSLKP